jgi:hypothetical protein
MVKENLLRNPFCKNVTKSCMSFVEFTKETTFWDLVMYSGTRL